MLDILFQHLPLIIKIIAGTTIYICIRTSTQWLASQLSKLRRRQLIFLWLREISSDVRNLGKGFAAYTGIAFTIALQWPWIIYWVKISFEIYAIIIIGIFGVVFLNVWEHHQINTINPDLDPRDRQFALTFWPLFTNGLKLGIYFLGIMSVCAVFNINIMPILGGIGLVGLIIGFGAQTLINDLISGVFIIFERLYYAESVIEIISKETDKISGTVDHITWRITYVREDTGSIVAVSNRTIDRIRVIRK